MTFIGLSGSIVPNGFITPPAGAQAGDLYILIWGGDSAAAPSGSMTDPEGTTRVLSDYVAGNSCWRVVVGTYDGSGAVGFPNTGTSAKAAAFFRDVTLGAVGTPWKRTSSGATLTCLALTRTDPDSEIVTLGGDRAINATAGEQGYTSLTAASILAAYLADTTLGVGTNICRSWWGQKSAAQSGDSIWTLNDSSGNGFGLQIELVPTAVSPWDGMMVWDGLQEIPVLDMAVWDGSQETPVIDLEVI